MKAKTELKENSSSSNVVQETEKDVFLEAMRETNDEISQLEELKKHAEKMKEDLMQYVMDIFRSYHLELLIPAKSLNLEGEQNLKSMCLNESGIIIYNFTDGTVRSQRLEDYPPSELITILNLLMPYIRGALETKRKEYERVSNRLTKVAKYLVYLKDKIAEKSEWIIWPFNKRQG